MKTALTLLAFALLLPACDLSSTSEADALDSVTAADTGGGGASGEVGNMVGMTAAHNAYRLQEHDVALVWDDDVAAYAQEWAEYLRDNHACELQHRSWLGMAVEPYGENLYGATAWGMALGTTAQAVVDAWWSEIEFYDYATNGCTDVCGHYTQVMWKGSTQVGCGMAVCARDDGGTSDVWVCNYNPPGNYVGQKPW